MDDSRPQVLFGLETLLHRVPVIGQEVEESRVASRASRQHREDQVDVGIREVSILLDYRHVQQPARKEMYDPSNQSLQISSFKFFIGSEIIRDYN